MRNKSYKIKIFYSLIGLSVGIIISGLIFYNKYNTYQIRIKYMREYNELAFCAGRTRELICLKTGKCGPDNLEEFLNWIDKQEQSKKMVKDFF